MSLPRSAAPSPQTAASSLPSEPLPKRALRLLLALAMVVVGVLHFARPEGFVAIVPKALPAPLTLVLISGFFEVLGGLGLLAAPVHRAAAWGLIALYVSVFPANINMAVNDIQPAGAHLSPALLWGRLRFQLVLIAWAYWLGRSPSPPGRNLGIRGS